MAEMVGGGNILRVVPPGETEDANSKIIENPTPKEDAALTDLAMFVRKEFEIMRNHRNSAGNNTNLGINERLLHAMQTFNGEYDNTKIREIKQFGGSEVYSRLTAVKCRGATSLLRDVYLGEERPWAVAPTPDPTLPNDIMENVMMLLQSEAQNLQENGVPVTDEMLEARRDSLFKSAKTASHKKAREEAKVAQTKIDDVLVEGYFYEALAELLVDLPMFPFAVMKGPTVRITPNVTWVDGIAETQDTPKMYWERVSPFDVYWSPGVSKVEDAAIIERLHITRTDLNDLIGLPGYDEEAIRAALVDYKDGLVEWMDPTDSERSDLESKENPHWNRTGIIHSLEYHGPVQGQMLLDAGFPKEDVEDPELDIYMQIWLVGKHVIKIQFSPSPRKRHPYFITSFEKVPGTIVGNSLTDILSDIQDVANASLRALVNNLSIASGPQVVINDDRLVPAEDADELYPWKRWHVMSDPMGSTAPPVEFFQPRSNSQELLQVYQKFTEIADEISAIPRYITGAGATGGAGRTASGLAMLMNNASKILQTVAANVDRDIMSPMLSSLYDMVLLTDTTGLLRGDESVRVQGVAVATQKETDRMRQMEFLQITANPIDQNIVGPKGRASLLRSISHTLGLQGEDIVPSEEQMDAQAKQQAQAAQQAQAGQAQGDQAPQGGGGEGNPSEGMVQTRDMPPGIEQGQKPPEGRI